MKHIFLVKHMKHIKMTVKTKIWLQISVLVTPHQTETYRVIANNDMKL